MRPVLLITVVLSALVSAGAAAKPEVHGHRGARARFPENTLPAFAHALAVGADVLELDLVVTRDDHLLVRHDPVIKPERCTVPVPTPVRQMSLQQARALDCGGRPHPKFAGQRAMPLTPPPTVAEVFALAAERPDVGFNIEAKSVPGRPAWSPPPERFAALIVAAVRRAGVEARVIVQSFDHRVLRAVKAEAPALRTAVLVDSTHLDYVAVARGARADIVSPHHAWIVADDVARIHRAGLTVVPWTANEPADWDRLVALGVDGIITDDPAALIAHLAGRR